MTTVMDEDDLKSYHAQHSGKLLGMDATDMVTYWLDSCEIESDKRWGKPDYQLFLIRICINQRFAISDFVIRKIKARRYSDAH